MSRWQRLAACGLALLGGAAGAQPALPSSSAMPLSPAAALSPAPLLSPAAPLPAPAARYGPAPLLLQASTREPRAYGYQVGDTLQRQVLIQVPDGLALDAASLPLAGARGQAIELRALRLQSQAVPGGQRQVLQLDYQVFLAPKDVRTLEIAPITLRYTGQPRDQSLRIDAWPVTVAPLLPLLVSPRQGLGDLQPDAAPPLIDSAALRQRLALWAGAATLLAVWLAWARLGWPWWQRRHLPFGQAWAGLRHLPDAPNDAQARAACQALHRALDYSAGQVLFEAGLAGWLARQPALAPLQVDLVRFLQLSQELFFAPGTAAPLDGAWLRALSRRCCQAERG